jgi:hypothetical protein
MSETMRNDPQKLIEEIPVPDFLKDQPQKPWTIFDEEGWHERVVANSDLDSTEINMRLSYATPENIKFVKDICNEVFGEHMKSIRITNSFWMDLESFLDRLADWEGEQDPEKKKELQEVLESSGHSLTLFFAMQTDGLVSSVQKKSKETNDPRNPDDIWNDMLDLFLKKLVQAPIKKKPGAL